MKIDHCKNCNNNYGDDEMLVYCFLNGIITKDIAPKCPVWIIKDMEERFAEKKEKGWN